MVIMTMVMHSRPLVRMNLWPVNWELTAKWGFICPIGAVRDAITYCTQIHTDAIARALPLPIGTVKGLSRAVLLVTHIPAVIVPITDPLSADAVPIGTKEMGWGAGLEHTAIVLIRSIDAVWVPITLPGPWDADTI